MQSAWNAGCSFVDFTGGEPLLHKDLPHFLDIARSTGFITSVTTNCILFPDRAEELSGKIDLLHFSLDADNESLHDKLHGAASFNAVLKSIAIARKYNMTPDLLFTYSNDNIDNFVGVSELARKHKIIVILDPVFSLNGIEQISAATHRKAKAFAQKRGVYLNEAHLKLRSTGSNHVREPLCRAVESTIVLLPDNKLALPCYHHRSEIISIGNNPRAIFSGDSRKKALEMQGRYSFCEGCHINCYFDPSYSRMRNGLHILSLISKLSYSIDKYIHYRNQFPIRIITTLLKQFFRIK